MYEDLYCLVVNAVFNIDNVKFKNIKLRKQLKNFN